MSKTVIAIADIQHSLFTGGPYSDKHASGANAPTRQTRRWRGQGEGALQVILLSQVIYPK
jgi:hypothetical protein